jgi:hypothetical protein
MLHLPLLTHLDLSECIMDDNVHGNGACKGYTFANTLLPPVISMFELQHLALFGASPVIFDQLQCPQLQRLDMGASENGRYPDYSRRYIGEQNTVMGDIVDLTSF